jgi:hypothetical protein
VLSYPSAMTVSSRAVNLLVVVARGDHEGAGQVGSRAVRSCAYLTVPVVLAGSSVFRGMRSFLLSSARAAGPDAPRARARRYRRCG